MISIYKSDEVKPLIINLLKKEGFEITNDNIKIWACDSMRAQDVKRACDNIKYNKMPNILVYTNKVQRKF